MMQIGSPVFKTKRTAIYVKVHGWKFFVETLIPAELIN